MPAVTRRACGVAVLVAASPVLSILGAPLAPATAATCAAGGGVSVVVDYNGLGPGGVSTGCAAGGGGDTASALFAATGHELTRAQRQPGFVCRVDAVPADDPCVDASPASAYWGLWWSDGESGEWTYSSLGVDSLKVPDGGSVAFSWDDVEGSAPPSATPPRAAASPSASPSSGSGSGGSGSGGSTSGSTGGSAPTSSPTASASPTAEGEQTLRERLRKVDARKRGEERVRVTSSPVPTDEATTATAEAAPSVEPETAPATSGDDGLPVWVAPVAVLVLAAAAGVTVLLRRRSTS